MELDLEVARPAAVAAQPARQRADGFRCGALHAPIMLTADEVGGDLRPRAAVRGARWGVTRSPSGQRRRPCRSPRVVRQLELAARRAATPRRSADDLLTPAARAARGRRRLRAARAARRLARCGTRASSCAASGWTGGDRRVAQRAHRGSAGAGGLDESLELRLVRGEWRIEALPLAAEPAFGEHRSLVHRMDTAVDGPREPGARCSARPHRSTPPPGPAGAHLAPRVAVVIPCFDDGATIREAVRSVTGPGAVRAGGGERRLHRSRHRCRARASCSDEGTRVIHQAQPRHLGRAHGRPGGHHARRTSSRWTRRRRARPARWPRWPTRSTRALAGRGVGLRRRSSARWSSPAPSLEGARPVADHLLQQHALRGHVPSRRAAGGRRLEPAGRLPGLGPLDGARRGRLLRGAARWRAGAALPPARRAPVRARRRSPRRDLRRAPAPPPAPVRGAPRATGAAPRTPGGCGSGCRWPRPFPGCSRRHRHRLFTLVDSPLDFAEAAAGAAARLRSARTRRRAGRPDPRRGPGRRTAVIVVCLRGPRLTRRITPISRKPALVTALREGSFSTPTLVIMCSRPSSRSESAMRRPGAGGHCRGRGPAGWWPSPRGRPCRAGSSSQPPGAASTGARSR